MKFVNCRLEEFRNVVVTHRWSIKLHGLENAEMLSEHNVVT